TFRQRLRASGVARPYRPAKAELAGIGPAQRVFRIPYADDGQDGGELLLGHEFAGVVDVAHHHRVDEIPGSLAHAAARDDAAVLTSNLEIVLRLLELLAVLQ